MRFPEDTDCTVGWRHGRGAAGLSIEVMFQQRLGDEIDYHETNAVTNDCSKYPDSVCFAQDWCRPTFYKRAMTWTDIRPALKNI